MSSNEQPETTDIFLWANKTDAVKNDLRVEFFLFNKNYTPYTTTIADNLDAQIKSLFLFDVINNINLGAGTGLSVRDYELSEKEENVLLRTGTEMERHVSAVLEGWVLPDITIKEVSFFYGHGGEYITIIALVDVSDGLKEGHQRLSLLPHVNTFGEYKPHITLAYVKASADWTTFVANLDKKFRGQPVKVKSINLGD